MRRVAMAEDRETAEKLREFFRSQGIDAEIRESGAEFEILVPDSKAEEALLMAKSLFESTREKRNQWDGDSDDAAEGGRLWERLRGAASVLLRDIIFSFRPVTMDHPCLHHHKLHPGAHRPRLPPLNGLSGHKTR